MDPPGGLGYCLHLAHYQGRLFGGFRAWGTQISRILIIRTPKQGTPNFRKPPFRATGTCEVTNCSQDHRRVDSCKKNLGVSCGAPHIPKKTECSLTKEHALNFLNHNIHRNLGYVPYLGGLSFAQPLLGCNVGSEPPIREHT